MFAVRLANPKSITISVSGAFYWPDWVTANIYSDPTAASQTRAFALHVARTVAPFADSIFALELVDEFVCAFDLTEELKTRIEALWMGNAWAFDEREFTYEEVNASRTEEMLRVERYNAKEDIWESEWQGEVFSCRWVDARRQGGVRSRIVIRDFRGEGHSVGATNEETFAATPDAGCDDGEAKRNRVESFAREAGVSLKNSIAYARAGTDAALMRRVGKAYAVSPDARLASRAEAEGWRTLRWAEDAAMATLARKREEAEALRAAGLDDDDDER